jgi:hypothetical protein
MGHFKITEWIFGYKNEEVKGNWRMFYDISFIVFVSCTKMVYENIRNPSNVDTERIEQLQRCN